MTVKEKLMELAQSQDFVTYEVKDKDKAFLEIAQIMSKLSPCSRAKVGAVIVKGDVPIISSFNGIARKQSRLTIQGIKHRFHQQQIDASINQRIDLLGVTGN